MKQLKSSNNDDVWIILAAYNEQDRIKSVLDAVKKHAKHIIVVDDGSKDGTADIVRKCKGVTLLQHKRNLGKGSAVRSGCDFAVKQGANILVLMDSDGQHDARNIPRFIKTMKDVDVVFGYRTERSQMPLLYKFGNWFLTMYTFLLFGSRIKDTQGGFRSMTSDAYKKIRWHATRYEMETEMIAHAAKHKLKYRQIPIKTIYHDAYKGTSVSDGFKICWHMLKWRLGL